MNDMTKKIIMLVMVVAVAGLSYWYGANHPSVAVAKQVMEAVETVAGPEAPAEEVKKEEPKEETKTPEVKKEEPKKVEEKKPVPVDKPIVPSPKKEGDK